MQTKDLDPAWVAYRNKLEGFAVMCSMVVAEFYRATKAKDWDGRRRAIAWLRAHGCDGDGRYLKKSGPQSTGRG